MPQLILYLLLGIFFVLNALAKCLVKVTQSSNSYIRNGLHVLMGLVIIFSAYSMLGIHIKEETSFLLIN